MVRWLVLGWRYHNRKGRFMSATDFVDWPADVSISPFRLVPWRQACSELDCSSNTLLRLLAEHKIGVVTLSARKRAVLACDLLKLVKAKAKPAAQYAAVKGAQHANV